MLILRKNIQLNSLPKSLRSLMLSMNLMMTTLSCNKGSNQPRDRNEPRSTNWKIRNASQFRRKKLQSRIQLDRMKREMKALQAQNVQIHSTSQSGIMLVLPLLTTRKKKRKQKMRFTSLLFYRKNNSVPPMCKSISFTKNRVTLLWFGGSVGCPM